MNTPFRLFTLLCLILLLGSANAFAQSADTSNLLARPTKSKDIAFVFYRLAGLKPDFAPLIQATNAYQLSDTATRQKMLDDDKAKMDAEFNAINPKSKVIIVRSAVDLKIDVGTDPGLKLEFPARNGPVYFAYQWAGENFAVIPDKMDAFLSIPMKIDDASAANSRLDRNGHATLVLELVPRSVDARAPLQLDGLNQWLMMADIGSLSFYNEYLQSIWSWTAPWYKRPDLNPLKEIKK